MKLEIDAASCIGCGACVRDCPMCALALDKARKPTVAPGKENNCIACQHCMAVCPVGALTLNGIGAADAKSANALDLPSARQIDDLFLYRRSIRQYRRQEVPEETISEMLSVLANTPTGCNAMGLTFTVVKSVETMDRLRDKVIDSIANAQLEHMLPRFIAKPAIRYRRKGIDEFFRGAPHLLIVSADVAKSTTPFEDCVAALAYFSMLAEARGIGTTWCGYLKLISNVVASVKDVFGIERENPYYAMLFGYPDVKYPRTVCRSGAAKIRYVTE